MQKRAKNGVYKGVSAIFSTLVTQIDSISHMMVVLNVSHHVAVVIGHARLIDYAKNGVFQGFPPFSRLW